MNKKFKIEMAFTYWICEVVIDLEVATPELLRELILFWSGGKSRLKDNDGDVVKTFVQQLGRKIYIVAFENSYNMTGVLSEFRDREGWPTLDGSAGVKLTYMDDVEIDHSDFEVEEVSNG